MSKANQLKRLERLRAANAPQRYPVQLYRCVIDGAEVALPYMEFAFLLLEGHKGRIGEPCGTRYEEFTPNPRPLSERLKEVDIAFEKAQEEYNAPEAVAKREAEYKELQRIGELRRMDFYAGRDMDKCHPLPWQKKDLEDTAFSKDQTGTLKSLNPPKWGNR